MSIGSLALSGCRIGLLTASASSRGGGVAEAVAAQAEMIRAAGGEAIVFALDDGLGDEALERVSPAVLRLARVIGPRQVGYAPGLLSDLLAAELDCLHLHGIWMHPSRVGLKWRRQTARPYLISPHGMLERWIVAHGRWKKALARWGYERANWRLASRFHALTPAEAEDIARETGRNDALVVPNPGPTASRRHETFPGPTLLFIGRIHPKKNLNALVRAWQRAQKPQTARLVIAGWGAERDVAALREAVKDDWSIDLPGPVFGEDKQRLLAAARFAILPSFSEGLPMAVLEAWAAGVPTVMSDACNLPEGFAVGAALPCASDEAGIAAAIESCLALSEARWRPMSAAAQSLAAGPFSRETVTARWSTIYSWLIAESA